MRAKSVDAVIFVVTKIEIEVDAGGKPHFCVAFFEEHRPIFDDLVLVTELDFGHGLHHVGRHADHLEAVGGDPGAAFQGDGVMGAANAVAANAAGPVGALPRPSTSSSSWTSVS